MKSHVFLFFYSSSVYILSEFSGERVVSEVKWKLDK